MMRSTRTNSARTALAAIALFAFAACLSGPDGATAARRGGQGPALFLGAGPGTPVPFSLVRLPEVDPGGAAELSLVTTHAFDPSFDELVSGNVVITTNSQMRAIWRRLFAEPYDPGLFDFSTSFVVLMGGGLMHPAIGFWIEAVESYEAAFQPVMKHQEALVEDALAVTAITFLGGPPPPPADDVYHVSAAHIDRAFLAPVLFHRDVLAAP